MRITILASVGCQNLGDELILKNTIKYFEKKYSLSIGKHKKNKPSFDVFTYDKEKIFFEQNNISYHEYFPIGIKQLTNLVRNIKNYNNFLDIINKSDKVVIGGGGLFFDNEPGVNTLKTLNSWIFKTNIIKKYNKILIFYGIGLNITKTDNKTVLSKIDKIFSGASEIYVRDNFSHEYLKKVGIGSEIILDPVYNDHKKFKEKKSIQLTHFQVENLNRQSLEKINFKGKTIGLALRKINIENYESKVIEIIEYIIQKGGKIIILPHSFHKFDNNSNDFLFFKGLLKKYYNLGDYSIEKNKLKISHSMEETYNYYREKELDIVLASRLHSIILAKVYKIKFVGISYSIKTEEHLS